MEPVLSGRTSVREDDMVTDTDGVAGEGNRFTAWDCKAELIGNTFSNGLSAIAIECIRKVEKLAAAQRTETGVEMIEAAVDQFERNDFPMEPLAKDRVHADVGSLPIATEPDVGKSQEIACAFKVKASVDGHHVIAVFMEPMPGMRFLSLAFRISEVTYDGRASDNQSGIRRKHEIGQSWDGGESLQHDP